MCGRFSCRFGSASRNCRLDLPISCSKNPIKICVSLQNQIDGFGWISDDQDGSRVKYFWSICVRQYWNSWNRTLISFTFPLKFGAPDWISLSDVLNKPVKTKKRTWESMFFWKNSSCVTIGDVQFRRFNTMVEDCFPDNFPKISYCALVLERIMSSKSRKFFLCWFRVICPFKEEVMRNLLFSFFYSSWAW